MNAKKLSSVFLLCSSVGVGGAELDDLKVLFVGDSKTSRTQEFTSFLSANVEGVTSVARKGFQPAQASSFDVVLLDWPQNEEARRDRETKTSPLGTRDQWETPIVLLGSAGLNLAVAWDLRGGAG